MSGLGLIERRFRSTLSSSSPKSLLFSAVPDDPNLRADLRGRASSPKRLGSPRRETVETGLGVVIKRWLTSRGKRIPPDLHCKKPSKDQLLTLQQQYNSLDLDKSGSLDMAELEFMFAVMGIAKDPHELVERFEKWGGGDAEIDFADFLQAFHETEVKPSDSELQRFLSYYPLPVLVAGYRRRKLLQAIIDHDGNTVKAFENERIVRMGGEDSVREADEHYKKLLGLESGLPCHAMFEVVLHKIFGSHSTDGRSSDGRWHAFKNIIEKKKQRRMVSQKTTISLDSSSLTQLAVDMHQHRTNANTAMKNTAHRDKVRNERGGWGESHVDEMIARANEEEVDEVGWMSKDLKKDMRLLEHRKQVNSSGRHMHLQEMHDRAAAYTERHNATQQLASHSQPPTMPRLGERRRNALSVSISTEGSATEGQLSSAHTVALAPRSQVVRPPKHFVGGTPRLAERRKLDGSFSRSIFPTTACEDGHTARVLGPVSAPRTPNTAQLGTAQTPRLVVPTPRTPRPVVPTPRQQHLPMSPSSAHDGREAAQPISSQQPATMVRTATVENIEVQLQRPSKNPVSKNLPPRKRTLKPIMPPQDLRRQSIAQPLQPSARLVVNL